MADVSVGVGKASNSGSIRIPTSKTFTVGGMEKTGILIEINCSPYTYGHGSYGGHPSGGTSTCVYTITNSFGGEVDRVQTVASFPQNPVSEITNNPTIVYNLLTTANCNGSLYFDISVSTSLNTYNSAGSGVGARAYFDCTAIYIYK